jgi:peptide/nickel transport system permease protein
MFVFDFGRADDGRDIANELTTRMGPSLAIALPTFVLGLFVTVCFALLLVFFRASYLDFWGVVLCVAMMSISGLFYIIGGQWLVSKVWHLVPISGYGAGLDAGRFLVLPVVIGVIAGIGGSARAGIARSSSRRRARTMCARPGPRGCPSCRRCSAMC